MAVNPKSLDNLIPPVKGEVRNPNGRGKGIPNAKTRYERILNAKTKNKNPVTGLEEEFTQLELMDLAIFAKALKGDIAAYKEVMDRLEGRPKPDDEPPPIGNTYNTFIQNNGMDPNAPSAKDLADKTLDMLMSQTKRKVVTNDSTPAS